MAITLKPASPDLRGGPVGEGERVCKGPPSLSPASRKQRGKMERGVQNILI